MVWRKFLEARRKLSKADESMEPCNKCDVIGTLAVSQILKLGKSSYNNCQMNFVNKNLERSQELEVTQKHERIF